MKNTVCKGEVTYVFIIYDNITFQFFKGILKKSLYNFNDETAKTEKGFRSLRNPLIIQACLPVAQMHEKVRCTSLLWKLNAKRIFNDPVSDDIDRICTYIFLILNYCTL